MKNYTKIKLNLLVGQAKPNPILGSALGQRGINIMDFCNRFNLMTSNIETGTVVPVFIHMYSDKTYKLIVKKPSCKFLLKKFIGMKDDEPLLRKNCIKIKKDVINKIISSKMEDLSSNDYNSNFATIVGFLKSAGIVYYE